MATVLTTFGMIKGQAVFLLQAKQLFLLFVRLARLFTVVTRYELALGQNTQWKDRMVRYLCRTRRVIAPTAVLVWRVDITKWPVKEAKRQSPRSSKSRDLQSSPHPGLDEESRRPRARSISRVHLWALIPSISKFDWIFNGKDIAFVAVELLQTCIQGCGFTRTCWTRYQDNAVRTLNEFTVLVVLCHT